MNKYKEWFTNFAKSVKNWLIVVLLLTCFILACLYSCERNSSKNSNSSIVTTSRTEIILRTIKQDTTIYKPYPIYTKGKDSIIYLINKMDSIQLAEIVKQFFETKYYHLILKNDSTGFAEVYTQVYQNLIEVLKYKDSSICKETTNIYKMIPAERFKLYLGAGLSLNPFDEKIYPDLTASIMWTYKGVGGGVSYGLFHKEFNFNFNFLLRFRKRK